MFRLISFLTAATIGLTSSYATAALSVSPDKGKVEFVAIGKPAMLKIKGTGKGPSADLKSAEGKISGQFKMDLQSLESGIGMRDEHMKKKYLEVEKFPEATLVFTDFPEPKAADSESAFKGVLKLHGVEKPIEGQLRLQTAEKNIGIKAHFQIKLSDFQIEIPSYAGIKVADQVEVDVQTEVTR